MSKRQVLSTSKKALDKADKARKSTPATKAEAPKPQAAAGLDEAAKGKGDKLITNAEAPAAECSRPMPPHGKGRAGCAQSVFSAIAEQLRAIPGRTDRILDAENTAGRLLAEALKHGAFARIKHTHLRTWIDGAIEKGLYHVAFGSAVNWFREYEPHWPAVAAWQNVGSSSCFKNGCPLLADVLEGEADVPEGERVLTPPVPGRLEAVAKAEELQRRQETARLSEQHLRRLGVVYGRRGVILGGQPPAAEAKAAAAEAQAGDVTQADDGRPFYKSAYFKQWNIGDDLLRRNASDKGEHAEGKVRRELKNPPRHEGKRPVYWYSETDTRKCWPDKFATVENQTAKA